MRSRDRTGTQSRRGLLATAVTLALTGCAGTDEETRTAFASRSATTETEPRRTRSPTRTEPGPTTATETESPTTTETLTSADETAYTADRPVRHPGFPVDPPALIGTRQMELVQPVRSQTEWKQLLQLGSEEARTLFSDYEFIAQTAFNRELVLVLQLRVHIDTSLQLRTLEQDRDSIQFRVDQRRVGDRDTLAMWYMFIRVPETEEPLERVEAEVGPGYRRIELVYYPQPCVCGHTETDE